MTHPFHPLFGREFEWVDDYAVRGVRRAFYRDEHGLLCSMPAPWTSLVEEAPVVALAAGRSWFRVEDLIRLADLIARVRR